MGTRGASPEKDLRSCFFFSLGLGFDLSLVDDDDDDEGNVEGFGKRIEEETDGSAERSEAMLHGDRETTGE